MRTEEELADAMRAAAGRAPDTDLLAGVARRRHRRSRRRAQALTVVSVVAVVGVSTAVARGVLSTGGGNDTAAAPTAPASVADSTPTDDPSEITFTSEKMESQPIEKLWPQAIFTMPAKSADGWRYRPITGLSATEVLLAAESSFEKIGRMEIYDTATGQFRVLTDVPTTPGLKEYYPQDPDLDNQNVAWYANAKKPDGTPVVEFWKLPRSGGTPERFGTLEGTQAKDLRAFAIDGDRVVWSRGEQGGVYSMSLAGGLPSPVAGGEGLFIIDWPWAGDIPAYGKGAERNQTKVVNVKTGEVRQVHQPEGISNLRCGAVWCFGLKKDSSDSIIQHVDGSNTGSLPSTSPDGYPILDRFLNTGDAVYDLETNTMATYKRPGDWFGVGTSWEPSTTLYWGATKGEKPDEYRMINLAAVPPAQ
ncbi:hypothetical protein [Nonomuraea sediminis]|uniref:hypothetical protein n=1 Tax=Nonomuraea sediminis TaxID=2835864 RepID=UPI001BDC0A83|nr:hypothetical protein [Nonomuraea sediminis]